MGIFYFSLCVLLIVLPNCLCNPVSRSNNNKLRKSLGATFLKDHELPANIIGGKKTDIKDRAFQVAIKIDDTFLGSGIIINKNWVATVASVVFETEASNITLLAENANYLKGKKYSVSEIVIHPEFDFFELKNDIALLRLSKPIQKFKKTLKSITIGSSSLADGSTVKISGWGDQSASAKKVLKQNASSQLTGGNLKIVNLDNCRLSYDAYFIFNSTICASGKDIGPCWNDFGDVITSKDGKAYGLFSWAKGCDVNEYPGIYTDLVYFNPWIKSVVGSKKSKRNIRSVSEVSEQVVNDRFNGNEEEGEANSKREEETEVENNLIPGEDAEEENDKTEEEIVLQKTFSNVFHLLQTINKEGFPTHLVKKRSSDSFSSNFKSNEDDEILEAIKLEEKEEENAAEEEKEQEEEEDEYEKEAIGIVKAVAENENFLNENEEGNELEAREIDDIIQGRHLINKRSVTNYEDDNGHLDDEIIEKAIEEEEKIEANAEKEELEQEEDEEEAEIEAEKLIEDQNTETLDQDELMEKNVYHFVGPYSRKIVQSETDDPEEKSFDETPEKEDPEDIVEAVSQGYEFLNENEEDPFEYPS